MRHEVLQEDHGPGIAVGNISIVSQCEIDLGWHLQDWFTETNHFDSCVTQPAAAGKGTNDLQLLKNKHSRI